MTKNTLNIILLGIVILLIWLIYNSEDNKNNQLEILGNTKIDSITSIIISRNNKTVTLNKQKDNLWQITQPISVAANNFRINSLLKLINAPVHNQYSSDQIDLKTTGLDNSATSVQFNQKIIQFGITNPATNLRYVRMNDMIYTIEDVYYPLINSHYSTLVSLNLLPADGKIKQIILPNQTITQDENNRWKSTGDVSADNVSQTLDLWKNAQAFGVHEYLPRENLGEITITLQSQKIIKYIVTDTSPWLIIARPDIGLEYHLEIESYAQLIEPVAAIKKQ